MNAKKSTFITLQGKIPALSWQAALEPMED